MFWFASVDSCAEPKTLRLRSFPTRPQLVLLLLPPPPLLDAAEDTVPERLVAGVNLRRRVSDWSCRGEGVAAMQWPSPK